ncbi:hypothetical protein L7F22_021931 [Adiantum nelumboides]|nr:hypothetical protein [Adiantum nelumboides]
MDGTRSMGSRSSSRHGPSSSALFTGPVRRWKKAWAPISCPAASSSSSSSKIFLYKWIPLPPDFEASLNVLLSLVDVGTMDDTYEETTIQPARYLPVSVALQRKDAAKRALEETEPTIQGSIDKVPDQFELSGILREGPNSKEQEVMAGGRQAIRDLNFSLGADISLDLELQDPKL